MSGSTGHGPAARPDDGNPAAHDQDTAEQIEDVRRGPGTEAEPGDRVLEGDAEPETGKPEL